MYKIEVIYNKKNKQDFYTKSKRKANKFFVKNQATNIKTIVVSKVNLI